MTAVARPDESDETLQQVLDSIRQIGERWHNRGTFDNLSYVAAVPKDALPDASSGRGSRRRRAPGSRRAARAIATAALAGASPSASNYYAENEAAMPDAFSRPLPQIDCEMRNLLTLNADAQQQLDSVRRQQGELERHELNLVTAIDGRRARLDRLLDERSRSLASAQMPTGPAMDTTSP